jgi:hypothetical protein
MSYFFYASNLTDYEKCKYKNIIQEKSNVSVTGCRLWQKDLTADGYATLKITFRGRKGVNLRVHRAVYFLHYGKFANETHHVSHLCHTRNCVNLEHLSLEPQSVNNNRQNCNSEGLCKGHNSYPNCIIRYVMHAE